MSQVATFSNEYCTGVVEVDTNTWVYTIKGTSRSMFHNGTVKYTASAPPDLRMSFSGSALPFPNEEVAYGGSVNKGEVPLIGSKFTFKVLSPNSYYKNNGSTLVKPHVIFSIDKHYFDIDIGKPFTPNRSLSSLPGRHTRSNGR